MLRLSIVFFKSNSKQLCDMISNRRLAEKVILNFLINNDFECKSLFTESYKQLKGVY